MAIAARWGGKPTAGSREPMGGSFKQKSRWLFDDSLGDYTTLHVLHMFLMIIIIFDLEIPFFINQHSFTQWDI